MSAERDRDGSVDRALRRSLSARSDRDAVTPCLEAETLAAFADQDLPKDERAAAEVHLADCARCQAMLAALVRTAPPSLVAKPWWRAIGAGWLVPLAAAATALVVWIAVPGEQPIRPPEPTSAVSSAPTPADTAKPDDGRGGEGVQAPTAQPKTALEPDARRTQAVAPSNAEGSNAPVPAAPAEPRADTAGAAAPARARAEAQEAESAPATPAPASAPAPPVSASAPPARFGASVDALAKTTLQANTAAAEIVSPDPSIRWRITGRRLVERSADGGATWQGQSTGTGLELLAGASPSATVCWLVGQSGLVLLTVDGQRWQTVTMPVITDLVMVRATDARTAAVTTADGRIFRTVDGGLTWIR